MRPSLQRLSAWADQGMFLWALHRNQATGLIDQSLSYNQPAFEQPEMLSNVFSEGHTLLEELKRRFPEDNVIHFLGPRKLSRQLDEQLEQIFCGPQNSRDED